MIVDELVRSGVTDAVLCPGSRSAPLAFALHVADAAGRLRLHVRIDERTAGFLAPSGLHFGQAPFAVFEQDALAGPVVRAVTGLLQAMMAVNQR